MAGIKIVNLPAVGRDLISTDLFELSLAGGSGSRKITGQEIMNASKLNVGGTPIINGTVGRILFQGASDTLGESANLFWDNTNGRLGIGGTPGAYRLDVNGNIAVNNSIYVYSTAYASYTRALYDDGSLSTVVRGNTHLDFWSANNFRMRINNSGNVLINTTTDAGFKLDVNGTARVGNDFTIGSNRYLKAFRWTNDDVTRSLQIEGNSNFNVDALNIISWNNNLLNNTKNLVNIGLSSTVSTQSSGSTDFFNSILIQTSYNFTFGTHTVKGIYYNPTLTSMVGTTHYAFHSTSGRVRLEGLPTSPAGLSAGDLYNNLGVLMIV